MQRITKRELEVWELIADGYERESIGYRLGIALRTVNTHQLNLVRKLGLTGSGGLPAKLTRLWMERQN